MATDRPVDLRHAMRRIGIANLAPIGGSSSPGPCELRHRRDVEQVPASTPTLLMTRFANA